MTCTRSTHTHQCWWTLASVHAHASNGKSMGFLVNMQWLPSAIVVVTWMHWLNLIFMRQPISYHTSIPHIQSQQLRNHMLIWKIMLFYLQQCDDHLENQRKNGYHLNVKKCNRFDVAIAAFWGTIIRRHTMNQYSVNHCVLPRLVLNYFYKF